MYTLEGGDFQALGSSDFPATEFFLHLANGTRSFHNREFEEAISEWEEAATLRPDFVGMKNIPGSLPFRSSLDDVPLVGLLYAVSSHAQTGVGIVRGEYAYKEIFFKEGWIVSARTTKSEERIGNFLLKSNLISPFNLEVMASQAKKSGARLGKFLVMRGVLLEKELLDLLEFQIQEILCDLFSWKEGEFYFTEGEVGDEDVVVSYTPLDVALFAARRALDCSAFRRMFPHNNVILYIPPSINRGRVKVIKELNANEEFIFSLIDGNRSIDQLIKFSGNDEVSVINILYRLASKGWVNKLRDIDTYGDTELEEISRFVRTFLDVFRLAVEGLRNELGVGVKEVLGRAWEGLEVDSRKIFQGIAMDEDTPPDEGKILENISIHYPDPSDRLIFIDGFYTLINNILEETSRILGMNLTKRVISDINKVRLDIFRFYIDSPIKKRVLEAFDAMVAQFPL